MEIPVEIAIPILLFLAGSAIASFSGTVAYRVCRDMSIIRPASFCEHCEARIPPAALFPVFGSLLYRLRCPVCGSKIPWQYPLAELLAGLFCAGIYLLRPEGGSELVTPRLLLWSGLSLPLVWTDIRCQRVPRSFLLPLTGAGIILHIIAGSGWAEVGGGILFAGGFFLAVYLLRPGALGSGDVEYSAVLGLFLGLELALVAVFAGTLLGGIWGAGLLLSGRAERTSRVAYLPFLFGGALVSLAFGKALLQLYAY